jgi:hypothetical protein
MLKGPGAMPRFVRIVLVLASMSTLALGPRVARAQTTATTATTATPSPPCGATVTVPTVTQSAQLAPDRYVNNVNLGTSTRANALTPNGVSYTDCTSNMQLRFQVEACGFLSTGSATNIEVWASTSTDCTATTDRGISVSPICWRVTPDIADVVQAVGVETIPINVRDIVAYQAANPPPVPYTPAGALTCNTAQPSYTQVPINLNFIPIVASTGAAAGPAYQYQIITDLVGPPPPSGVMLNAGDTLVVASWTPNVDSDTTGYDVVIDPAQGQGTPTASGGATQVLVCPDSGTTTTTTASPDASQPDDASLSDATSDDAQSADSSSADATVGAPATPASADAGCHLLTVANTSTASNGGSCNDLLLTSTATSTTVVDSGEAEDAAVETTPIYDEAGDLIDSSVVAPLVGGGIWVPPANHIVNPDPTIGTTVAGATTSTYTVTGLVNGVMYTAVVAAVDALGNVGLPSTQACKQPKPVNDFWKIYRGDGGGAGGGFCALEAVGAPAGSTVALMGAGALALAGVRRRRSKRR